MDLTKLSMMPRYGRKLFIDMKRDFGKVSVIVPIYNVEKQLRRCVESIRSQSYADLEIILVDDGSPDRCGNICDEYKNLDERIKVVHKENGGLGYARNSGLDVATGDYVVFIDSDDYIESFYVEKLLERMVHENADYVTGGFIREKNERRTDNPVTDQIKIVESCDVVKEILMPIIGSAPDFPVDVEREMCVWRNMYCMDIIADNDLRFVSEREYVSEDIFYNTQYILKVKKAVLIPECIYIYSDNATSLTNTYRSDRYDKYKKMMGKELTILKENGIYDDARLRLYRTFIMKTKKCIASIAASELSISEQRKECNRILKDNLFSEIINDYYDKANGKSQKAVLFMMRSKMSLLLLLLYKAKNR